MSNETRAVESNRTRLVGHNDLQGRESLQVVLREDWCYVGHLPGDSPNPLTGQAEHNGTSVLNVSDPAKPTLVAHIPGGAPGANCRAVNVIKARDGRDYIIRNHETKSKWSFQVFDVTDRASPKFVSDVGETPAGPLVGYAHKGWWDESTGLYFGSACEQGFRPGGHMVIWDLSKPAQPKYVSSFWLPGQKLNEPDPGPKGSSLHHAVVDMPNKKAYLSYHRGGDVAVVDLSDITKPQLSLRITISPPFKGPHTAMPINNFKCPNFTPGFDKERNLIVFCNEASDADYRGQEVRTQVFMMDATAWKNPLIVDTFMVPDGDFLGRGGRFGPHQFAETRDNKLYNLADNRNLLWVAYFAGGLRIVDATDPFNMKEAGYYIPQTTSRTIQRRKTVIQTNDVDLDYRGLGYITDRAGTGLHVIEYLG